MADAQQRLITVTWHLRTLADGFPITLFSHQGLSLPCHTQPINWERALAEDFCQGQLPKVSSVQPKDDRSCDPGQEAFPLWFLFCNTEGVWRRSGWYHTMVSSELNLVKYCSLPSNITLFYFIHSTFHIAGDLGYLFTYWSVCLPH